MLNQLYKQLNQIVILIRAGQWWSVKGAPALGTVYATAFVLNGFSLIKAWKWLVFLLVTVAIVAIYAEILNDFTDQEQDTLSGKTNRMVGRSTVTQTFLLAICTSLLFLPVLVLIHHSLLLGIYLSTCAVFTVYSLPPLRLKECGFWGTLADALGSHVLPQIFAVLMVANAADHVIPLAWLICIFFWSLATGLRGIFWHQLLDLENDQKAGVNTFAVSHAAAIKRFTRWVLFPFEILSLVGILLLSSSLLGWLLLALHSITEWLRHYFWSINLVIVEPINNHRFLLHEYYEFFYPLTFLALAIQQDRSNLIILVIHLLLYPQRLWWWLRDTWVLLRWEVPIHLRSQ
uniref:UbiA prenyltransferase n=1 Tax=Cyanothece sp. (strain PCC 7425 / ATCC 29141) TaxID=395961 RepID=B8HVF8_CYAP4